MIDVIMLVAGAAMLIFAGDFLVKAAVALSLKLGLTPAVVGLTVVALGTSAPELVICVQAALDGAPDIATGGVVGSNIANILLVLGVAALITPILAQGRETYRNALIMVLVSIALLIVAQFGMIYRWMGAVMVTVLGLILYQAYLRGRTDDEEGVDQGQALMGWPKLLGLLAIGIIGLPIGANLFIEGARNIALSIGISEAAIGLTLVAIGTSLPELAATVMAALRGRTQLAFGNAIGSNLFNLLGILGVTAIVTPVPVAESLQMISMPIMVLASALLLPFLWRSAPIGRTAGAFFTLGYAGFAGLSLLIA